MRSFSFHLWLAMCVAWLPAMARADDGPPPSPNLVPPVLEQFVQAELGPDVAAADGAVGMILSIDTQGRVTEALVESSLAPELDQAAVSAALRFVFKPASRDGINIPSRVRYQYAFRAPVPAPAPVPTTGELVGTVTDRVSEEPLADTQVTLVAQDGKRYTTTSDAAGQFRFVALEPGAYTLNLEAFDHQASTQPEHVVAGESIEVSYRLLPITQNEEPQFSATAQVEAPSREIVRRSIAREELTRMAGTRGDPLRTIELLPGVARPPFGGGMVLVRGSAPGDSEVFLDGAPIYNLYHFGGLTSVVNGFLLTGIDLYPGNFSARYGRKTGGVIETNLRDPKSDQLHGLLDVNLIDASLLVEAPINDKLSFAVAGRRSYMDTWFKAVAESAELAVIAAPVYYDYQGILAYKPSSKERLRAIVYGSYDEFTLISGQADEKDPALRGRFSSVNTFHRGQLEWHRDWSDKHDTDVMVGAGPVIFKGRVGPELGGELRGFDVLSRAESHLRIHPRLRLNTGLDVQLLQTHIRYYGPRAQQSEGDPSASAPIAGRDDPSDVDTTRSYARPAAYTELVARVTQDLELTGGLRADYFGDASAFALDPRLNARLFLGATTLRAGVGRFSQPPDISQTLPGFGNPKLGALHAIHVGAGIEQKLDAHSTASLDGFYKHLTDLVVNGDGAERLVNKGKGRIYGLELMGRLQPAGRFSGFLSYTLSRSERNDQDGKGTRLFDYDQTHILTASGNVKLGKGWLLGNTFRLASGNPTTPVVGGLYNANLDIYTPVYGDTNSARSKYFHRLDVRVEKKWELGANGAGITAYLDVQNIYNRRNPEGSRYNFDYSQTGVVAGLPIIPSLGLRGEI